MLKIYFGTKPLFITDSRNAEVAPYLDSKGTVVLTDIKDTEIGNMIRQMQEPDVPAGVIFYNPDQAINSLRNHLVQIQAAGGLVYAGGREILMIYRRGKWDLPKGKLDEGEDLETCAKREVEEETGIKNLALERKICVTYHTYYQGADYVLKESHWYLMRTNKGQKFTPQTDEDIEKCEWVALAGIDPYIENTHLSITDVLNKGLPLIRESR